MEFRHWDAEPRMSTPFPAPCAPPCALVRCRAAPRPAAGRLELRPAPPPSFLSVGRHHRGAPPSVRPRPLRPPKSVMAPRGESPRHLPHRPRASGSPDLAGGTGNRHGQGQLPYSSVWATSPSWPAHLDGLNWKPTRCNSIPWHFLINLI
jgi:hypothetical protein